MHLRGAPAPFRPELIQLLAFGPVLTASFYAAIDLGVFDALAAQPCTLADLAKKTNVSEEPLERLLSILTSLGLVEREENGAVRNHPMVSGVLTREVLDSVVPLLEYQREDVFRRFEDLAHDLRTWSSQRSVPDPYRALSEDPDRYGRMLRAMDIASTGVGAAMAKQVDFGRIRRLIDLGGGGGQLAIELCSHVPHLTVELVETDVACAVARARIQALGIGSRIRCTPLDLRGDLASLEPADAVLLSGVLSDFTRDERVAMLKNARRLLLPEGRVLISETLLDDDRSGPLLPAMLSLYMLLSTGGNNFTKGELTELLDVSGFRAPDVFYNGARGSRDLIVAQPHD